MSKVTLFEKVRHDRRAMDLQQVPEMKSAI